MPAYWVKHEFLSIPVYDGSKKQNFLNSTVFPTWLYNSGPKRRDKLIDGQSRDDEQPSLAGIGIYLSLKTQCENAPCRQVQFSTLFSSVLALRIFAVVHVVTDLLKLSDLLHVFVCLF